MDGWIDVGEVPFVSRDLAVRSHIPLPGQKVELFLRKGGIHHGERDAVECSVPGGEEGIFPLVRHRENIFDVEVTPLAVSDPLAFRRRFGLGWVAVDPLGLNEAIELFAPVVRSQDLQIEVWPL